MSLNKTAAIMVTLLSPDPNWGFSYFLYRSLYLLFTFTYLFKVTYMQTPPRQPVHAFTLRLLLSLAILAIIVLSIKYTSQAEAGKRAHSKQHEAQARRTLKLA